tara:strand:+ start:744 stop:1448 length:705 start_codon:yes stop_codon:yes gene_type:complete
MLPKLVTPKYDMIVPSTGESITYRPYVVKEEKILLIAMESQNEAAVEKAVTDIIKTCIETPIDFKELTSFDVEMIFITLRTKSVGEGVDIQLKCSHCEALNDHKINLEKIKVKNLEDAPDKHIKLTDDISVDMKWLKMDDRLTDKERETGADTIINMIAKSIETIYSGEEIFAVKDAPKKEVLEFVESLSTDQFAKMVDVVGDAPRLHYEVDLACTECGKDSKIELTGLNDFFQ